VLYIKEKAKNGRSYSKGTQLNIKEKKIETKLMQPTNKKKRPSG
jgi:hypothetical protein